MQAGMEDKRWKSMSQADRGLKRQLGVRNVTAMIKYSSVATVSLAYGHLRSSPSCHDATYHCRVSSQ